MSLFGKKKDKEPNYPDLNLALPKFPEYPGSDKSLPKENPFPPIDKSIPAPLGGASWRTPKEQNFIKAEPGSRSSRTPNGERPLFIKIEKYNEVMGSVDKIRNHLKRTDEVLDKLQGIRSKEEQEIQSWQDNIRKLKDRLLEIDNILFETGK